MAIELQKIGEAGTRNPIVARLGSQTVHLVQWLNLGQGKREAVEHLYLHTLMPRLLRCATHRDELVNKLIDSNKADSSQLTHDLHDHYVPHIAGLQDLVKGFLDESNNFLLDLLQLFQIVYNCELKVSSAFVHIKERKDSDLLQWAVRTFGTNDDLTKIVRSAQVWVTKFIRMRNAIEDPKRQSGTLTVQNVRARAGRPGFIPPTWQLTGGLESAILTDMDYCIGNLLTLSEDLLLAMIGRTAGAEHVQFNELPLEQRNPECPMRIRIELSKQMPGKRSTKQ